MQYENGDATYRIKPECKKSKFARKLLKKRENDEDLTGYQRKYLKNLMRKGGAPACNTLVCRIMVLDYSSLIIHLILGDKMWCLQK